MMTDQKIITVVTGHLFSSTTALKILATFDERGNSGMWHNVTDGGLVCTSSFKFLSLKHKISGLKSRGKRLEDG